jgi:hypothetical protein
MRIGIDTSDTPARYQGEFEPLAPGWYTVRITDAEVKETKAGTGFYVKIEYTLENERKHWENYNIKNENEKAEEIGRGQFNAVCYACGLATPATDTNQLLNKKLQIKLKIEPAKGEYGPRNRVTQVESAKSAAAATETTEELPDFLK